MLEPCCRPQLASAVCLRAVVARPITAEGMCENTSGALTVSRQVVDKRGQEGDEHTGDDDVDDVEEGFAFDDQVEGDVLVLVALHGNVLVGVSLSRSVDDLPLAVLCRKAARKKNNSGLF